MRNTPGTGVVLDEARLKLLLRYGNNLLVTRDAAGHATRCVVSGLLEIVPLDLFNAYLANGWIEDVARGIRYSLSPAARKHVR